MAQERPQGAQDNTRMHRNSDCSVGSRPQDALLYLYSSGDLLLSDEAFCTTACAFTVGWNDWTPKAFSLLVFFMLRSRAHKYLLHNVIVIIKIKTSGFHGS